MAALAAGRNTPELTGELRSGGVAAATKIFQGGIVMRNAAGNLTKGATATGLVGVGRAEETVDNTGSAGAKSVEYKKGVFRFANSSSTDEITAADIGGPAYVVDDQTVAKTSGTNTRSIAGKIEGVDAQGVWVGFDEAWVKAFLS